MDGHNDEAQEYKKNKDKENGEAMRDGVLDDGGGNINGFSKLEPSHIPPSSSSSSSDNADVVLAPSVIGSFQGHRCIVILFLKPNTRYFKGRHGTVASGDNAAFRIREKYVKISEREYFIPHASEYAK